MNVFVLTTEDGGDNELFCGCVSTLEGVDLDKYTFYKVEVDGPFNYQRVPHVPSQVPNDNYE